MSCEAWQSMIALDVGGDLPAADAERLTRHLAACAACRRLASEMLESQGAVALLADAPVPEEIMVSVRAGVMRRIGEPSTSAPFRLPTRALALAATIAVAFGALLLLRSGALDPKPPAGSIEDLEAPHPPRQITEMPSVQQPTTDPPSPIQEPRSADAMVPDRVATTAAPNQTTIPPAPKPLATVTVTPVDRAATPPVAATGSTTAVDMPANEPMVIKLVSDDADIVIYWLVEPSATTPTETKHETSAV